METIQIGPMTFTIKEIRNLNDTAHDLNGSVDLSECVIKVREGIDPQVKFETIWHEAIHVILEQAGIPNHKEKIVTALAYGIINLLKQNPGMVSVPEERIPF